MSRREEELREELDRAQDRWANSLPGSQEEREALAECRRIDAEIDRLNADVAAVDAAVVAVLRDQHGLPPFGSR